MTYCFVSIIQGIMVIGQNINNLGFYDCIFDDGYMWFFNTYVNALMRVSIDTWKVDYYYTLPKHRLEERAMYKCAFSKGKHLLWAPGPGANELLSFSYQTKVVQLHEFADDINVNNVLFIDNCFWFIPAKAEMGLYFWRTESDVISKFSEWDEFYNSSLPKQIKAQYTSLTGVSVDDEIHVLFNHTNYMVSFNPSKGVIVGNRMTEGNDAFRSLSASDGVLFFSDDLTGDIYEYNMYSKERIIYKTGNLLKANKLYVKLLVKEDKIFALPSKDPKLVVCDRNTGNVLAIDFGVMSDDFPLKWRDESAFYNFGLVEEGMFLYVLPCSGRYLFKIDSKSFKLEKILIEVSDEWKEYCYEHNLSEEMEKKSIIEENSNRTLNNYIHVLAR